MESIPQPPGPPSAPAPGMSLGARFVAVFARPSQAWAGLEKRGQWWFPLLLSVLVAMAGVAATYQRAVVPTELDKLQRQIEAGQAPAGSLEEAERIMRSPVMSVVPVVVLPIVLPAVTLAIALLPWLAVGFIMGRRFRYRDAFVVTSWAGLVTLPAAVIQQVLYWVRETTFDVHIGFGALLPPQDAPSKLMAALGFFLDYGIGPFYLWYVAVMALGAAALSGAPRRPVLLAIGGVWLVVTLAFAGLAGLFTPGS